MKKQLLIIFSALCFCCIAHAQYRLSIVVKQVPQMGDNERIYVAGSFNNWNPSTTAFTYDVMQKIWRADIVNLKADVYEFKFTKGSWNSVQASKSGGDVQNNLVKLSSDTIVHYDIESWKDPTQQNIKKHTASSHVSILDSAFYMPQLNTTRRIWLYLPEGYATSNKKYPVLYMHDGQNIFDEYTSGYGEWGVDECLDSLIAKGKQACIVVGIDNGPKRMNEYNPVDNVSFGKGEGEQYINFIATTLKPFIDKHYRTFTSPENTVIAGSSMGGLISYYAMLKYPEVFGKAGIFSPAFWTAPGIDELTDELAKKVKGRFFFYAGGSESESMIKDMVAEMDDLAQKSSATIYAFTDEESRHNEEAWRKWFADFYLWIMADGNNVVVKLGE